MQLANFIVIIQIVYYQPIKKNNVQNKNLLGFNLKLYYKVTNSNKSQCFQFIECKHGYAYDRTWYKETIPSQENWVCEKDLYMTNTFVVSRILEVLGAFVLGQLGDS